MVTALFFNLDDTLTEQVKSYEKIFEIAVEKSEVSEMEGKQSKYTEKFFKFFKKNYAFPRRQAVDKLLREEGKFSAEKVESFVRAWEEAESESLEIKEGVKDILKELSENYVLGIVSNGTGRLQRMKLENLGIRDFFESVVVSTEIGYRKPEQEFFETAKTFVDADKYVVISHFPKRDILAGRKAGFKAVWLTDTEKQVDKEIALTVDSIESIPGKIEEI